MRDVRCSMEFEGRRRGSGREREEGVVVIGGVEAEAREVADGEIGDGTSRDVRVEDASES